MLDFVRTQLIQNGCTQGAVFNRFNGHVWGVSPSSLVISASEQAGLGAFVNGGSSVTIGGVKYIVTKTLFSTTTNLKGWELSSANEKATIEETNSMIIFGSWSSSTSGCQAGVNKLQNYFFNLGM